LNRVCVAMPSNGIHAGISGLESWDNASSTWDDNFKNIADAGLQEGIEFERKERRQKVELAGDLLGDEEAGAIDDPGDDQYLWVMVFKNEDHDCYEMTSAESSNYRRNRVEVVTTIKQLGMFTRKHKSRDDDEKFVKIFASQDYLETIAEKIQFPVKLKKGGYVPFLKEKRALYWSPRSWSGPEPEQPLVEDGEEDPTMKDRDFRFTSSEKRMIVLEMLERKRELGGGGLDLGKMIVDGHMIKMFPSHGQQEIEWLKNHWGKFGLITTAFLNQPVERVKEYFGPQIGLYFAFLGFYTKSLCAPCLAGLYAFAVQVAQNRYDVVEAIPFFALFICFYGTFLLEGWKRREITCAFRWGTIGFEKTERPRPEFIGEKRLNPVTGEPEDYYPEERRNVKMATLVCLAVLSALIVALGVCCVLMFRYFLQKTLGNSWGSLSGVINGIMINVFNNLYQRLAFALNDWENHKTDTAYDDSLIVKCFLFQFINSYMAMYVVAFIKPNANYFSAGDYFGTCECMEFNQNGCDKDMLTGPGAPRPPPGGTIDCDCTDHGYSCIDELSALLLSIFAVQLAIGNFMEFCVPLIKAKLAIAKEEKEFRAAQEKSAGGVSAVEELPPLCNAEYEAKLEPYDGPFGDYNELIIQYGYVNLFSAAFPLCALLALLNNMIEIRSDALKFLKCHSRPWPRGAEDIGSWYMIMDLLTYASVLTNCGLVWFVSTATQDYSSSDRIWGFILSEHIIIMLKVLAAFLIPDVPEKTQEAMEKDDYRKKCAAEEALMDGSHRDNGESKFEQATRMDKDEYEEHDDSDTLWMS